MTVACKQRSPAQILSEAISEEAFVNQIIELGHLNGWLVSHFRPGWTEKGYRTPIQGDKGFYDLVLVRREKTGLVRWIMAEIKSEKGKLSPDQERWQSFAKGSAVLVTLWRPSMIEEVIEILK